MVYIVQAGVCPRQTHDAIQLHQQTLEILVETVETVDIVDIIVI